MWLPLRSLDLTNVGAMGRTDISFNALDAGSGAFMPSGEQSTKIAERTVGDVKNISVVGGEKHKHCRMDQFAGLHRFSKESVRISTLDCSRFDQLSPAYESRWVPSRGESTDHYEISQDH